MQQETNIPQPGQDNSESRINVSDNKEGWRSVLSTVLILALAPVMAFELESHQAPLRTGGVHLSVGTQNFGSQQAAEQPSSLVRVSLPSDGLVYASTDC